MPTRPAGPTGAPEVDEALWRARRGLYNRDAARRRFEDRVLEAIQAGATVSELAAFLHMSRTGIDRVLERASTR